MKRDAGRLSVQHAIMEQQRARLARDKPLAPRGKAEMNMERKQILSSDRWQTHWQRQREVLRISLQYSTDVVTLGAHQMPLRMLWHGKCAFHWQFH